jgi:hypothetical protein
VSALRLLCATLDIAAAGTQSHIQSSTTACHWRVTAQCSPQARSDLHSTIYRPTHNTGSQLQTSLAVYSRLVITNVTVT